jgi:carbon monoxide dehydrogenase subunit G
MKLEHSFSVPLPPDEAFLVLTDVARIAPCMPGASVQTVTGDEFTGTVKVKVGPITISYGGQARFLEKNAAERRVVIEANGKEARGGGTAQAIVTSILRSGEEGTVVDVVTDLAITGKPAQFGRGVMVDVGNKIIGQFADALAAELREARSAAGGGTSTSDGDAASLAGRAGAQPSMLRTRPTPEAIDLLSAAGGSAVKRLGSAVLAALAFITFGLVKRRRRNARTNVRN